MVESLIVVSEPLKDKIIYIDDEQIAFLVICKSSIFKGKNKEKLISSFKKIPQSPNLHLYFFISSVDDYGACLAFNKSIRQYRIEQRKQNKKIIRICKR